MMIHQEHLHFFSLRNIQILPNAMFLKTLKIHSFITEVIIVPMNSS